MNFDQIIFSSRNSFHVYEVNGHCNFADKGISSTQTIVCTLDEIVEVPTKPRTIEVNGIAFICSNIQINDKTILGEIEKISSFEYTDALKFG